MASSFKSLGYYVLLACQLAVMTADRLDLDVGLACHKLEDESLQQLSLRCEAIATLLAHQSSTINPKILLDAPPVSHLYLPHSKLDLPVLATQNAEAITDLKVVIEIHNLLPSQIRHFKQNGVKVIHYGDGDDLNDFTEEVIYNLSRFNVDLHEPRDATIVALERPAAFAELLYQSPVHVLPPALITRHDPTVPDPMYHYDPTRCNVAVLEENDSIYRNSIFPLLAVEAFERFHPGIVNHTYVTKSEVISNNEQYKRLITWKSSAYKNKQMSFEGQHGLEWFLSTYTDIVFAYQWDSPSNQIEFDALSREFPLVHNNPRFKDCGYYYHEHDVDQAIAALARAAQHGQDMEQMAAYNKQAAACVQTFSPVNEDVVAAWREVIVAVANSN
eukprot:TRINITY_DN7899_c0_g1_i1.p1 TRINITY_DN7899_c0_g1~~TRINITY_DN7899_c0_g1_i1.p1  ORF type:complete len:388 (+),score=64.68 TRINITY_DN7899_c0_g1_i1:2-1165(+)